MNSDSLPPDPRSRNVAVAAFVIIAVILVGIGYWYYQSEKEEITHEKYQTLAAIGELKSKQIQQWRKERMAKVERAAKDGLTRKAVSDVLTAAGDQNFQKELHQCLQNELTGQDSGVALLFDTRGNLLASTDNDVGTVDATTQKAIREVIGGQESVVSDFYSNSEGVIHIDLVAPVPDEHGQFQAVLVLRHEAASYLYPLLEEWPTPSRSAETIMAQRDGDEVVFLSKLRHRGDLPLSLRHPLTETQLPAVQAVLGKQGVFEGKDYRGVEVVSALLPVFDSPWFLEAKVDAEEILAEARYRAGVISLIIGLLIMLTAGLIGFFYKQRQAGILNNLVKAERQKAEAQEREIKAGQQHQTILQTAMDGFCIVDVQGLIREVNEAYCRMTGYSEEELLAMRISDLETVESREETRAHIQKIITEGQDRFESRQRRKDGEFIDIEVSAQVKPADKVIVAFLRDITERKRVQSQLVRSERMLRDSQETARIGHYIMDLATGLWESSPTLDRLFGIDRDFVRTTHGWDSLLHPEDREKTRSYLLRCLENLETFRMDYRIIRPTDGESRWMAGYGDFEYDDSGKALRFLGCIQDITEQKKAEEALRVSEKQFRSMFESASIGMAQCDPQTGQWLRVNQKMCQITGYSSEEMLKMHVRDITHPDDREKDTGEFQRVVCGESPSYRMEKRYVRKDGKEVWVNVNMTVIRNADDTPVRTMATIEDISGRKRAEEQRKTLLTAVEQSANTIVITDRSGTIEYVNPAFEKNTGYAVAEAIGQNPRILKSGEQDAGFYRDLWATIVSGKTWQGEMLNKRKDGTPYWESVTISPVSDDMGEILHFIAIKENITERKAMQAALSEALYHAEEGSRAKSEFLAIMSHELRTPLNGVLGFSELLTDTPLDEEQKSCVETISNSGNHLLAIVNDILDFSSIEKGAMAIHVEPFACSGLMKSSEQAVQKSAMDKGLAFRTVIDPDVPEQIHGNEQRIRQILINLLGNGVKFTSKGSVTLRVATVKMEGRQFLDFSVEDSGIGMSPETIGILFNPFTQADMKRNRTFGGTGLGLAISQRLAEAMGGKITVISTLGKGSTFTFRLPLKTSSLSSGSATPTHAFPDSAHPSGALVLVVEDDQNSTTLMGKMLESLGHRAEFAADGAEAVRMFEPGKFSAIFMDMAMPVMDGLEATKIIRERESGTRIPIIALTANVMPGDRERCLAAGMDAFLSKPFKREELAAMLARVAHPIS